MKETLTKDVYASISITLRLHGVQHSVPPANFYIFFLTLYENCVQQHPPPHEITGHSIGGVACIYLSNPDFAVPWSGKEDDGDERENIGGAGAG